MSESERVMKNRLGDFELLVEDSVTHKQKIISFNYKCDKEKLHWAQQVFMQLSNIVIAERGKPIKVKRLSAALNDSVTLKKICEYWEMHHKSKPLWNWSRQEIIAFLRLQLPKLPPTEGKLAVYSYATFVSFTTVLNASHKAKLQGKVIDGTSLDITTKIKREATEDILMKYGLTYGEWMDGESYPPVPFGIAAYILNKSIEIIESEKTHIALCLYSTWRKQPKRFIQILFKVKGKSGDIIERYLNGSKDKFGFIAALIDSGHSLKSLPWKSAGELAAYCDRVIDAVACICFIQTGYRYSELMSSRSTEQSIDAQCGAALIYQTLDKTLGGMRVPRPIPQLSKRAVDISWGLSFLDANIIPHSIIHRSCRTPTCSNILNKVPDPEVFSDTGYGFSHDALTTRLNKFYQEEIICNLPEAHEIHPKLTYHQFRHSFAEFSLRRFDEDVHESLREHFFHLSTSTTKIYEKNKLSDETRTIVEKNYLRALFGKIATGVLDERFWGPAFLRLKSALSQIKYVTQEQADETYSALLDNIERIIAFEWGYCVYFKSSKTEARCRDPQTGLPQLEGGGSAERCTGCPNNMGNCVQKNNILRRIIMHNEVASTHVIKALGKLSSDMAEQMEQRIKVC